MKQDDLLSFDILNQTLNLMHKHQVENLNIKPLKTPLESISLSDVRKPPVELSDLPESLKIAFRRYSQGNPSNTLT